MSKALINNTSLAEIFIAVSQNDRALSPPNLTINQIIEAEARASLVDAKLFTREAVVILTKGSRKFINKISRRKLWVI